MLYMHVFPMVQEPKRLNYPLHYGPTHLLGKGVGKIAHGTIRSSCVSISVREGWVYFLVRPRTL